MGSIQFHHVVQVADNTVESIDQAHFRLLADALTADPFDSYDGTISTCEGWELRKAFDADANVDEVRDFIDVDVKNAHKWEAAFVVIHGTTAHFYGWAAT